MPRYWNGQVPERCRRQFKEGEEWNCFFGYKVYPTLRCEWQWAPACTSGTAPVLPHLPRLTPHCPASVCQEASGPVTALLKNPALVVVLPAPFLCPSFRALGLDTLHRAGGGREAGRFRDRAEPHAHPQAPCSWCSGCLMRPS